MTTNTNPMNPIHKISETPSPYGNCPICGAPGAMRERRLNGNDRCAKGHEYPSSSAVKLTQDPTEPVSPPVPDADSELLDRLELLRANPIQTNHINIIARDAIVAIQRLRSDNKFLRRKFLSAVKIGLCCVERADLAEFELDRLRSRPAHGTAEQKPFAWEYHADTKKPFCLRGPKGEDFMLATGDGETVWLEISVEDAARLVNALNAARPRPASEGLRTVIAAAVNPGAFHPDIRERHRHCSPYTEASVQDTAYETADRILAAIAPWVGRQAGEEIRLLREDIAARDAYDNALGEWQCAQDRHKCHTPEWTAAQKKHDAAWKCKFDSSNALAAIKSQPPLAPTAGGADGELFAADLKNILCMAISVGELADTDVEYIADLATDAFKRGLQRASVRSAMAQDGAGGRNP